LYLKNTELAKIVLSYKTSYIFVEDIKTVAYDTRRIVQGTSTVFFALKGTNSDGHLFIPNAYYKGIRTFVVSKPINEEEYPKATFLYVKHVQEALFLLAEYVRNQLKARVVIISGGIGKTSVKEWLYAMLSPQLSVSRSPKSYNSYLGVMLSIIEANTQSDVLLIEVKPHIELSPEKINSLIRPEIGIVTSTETKIENSYFSKLFKGCTDIYYAEDTKHFFVENAIFHVVSTIKQQNIIDKSKKKNIALAKSVAQHLGISKNILQQKISQLPDLTLRMETFEGKNENFIIIDLYNLDITAFKNSLEFQKSVAQNKNRTLILNIKQEDKYLNDKLKQIFEEFQPLDIHYVDETTPTNFLTSLKNNVVLVKGEPSQQLIRLVDKLRNKRHATELRIDLKALRKNIAVYRRLIPENIKIMAMLKATGYGSGLNKIAKYIDGFGVDYFGVAFVDEGIELRKTEIYKPIMVMNVPKIACQSCIENNLEPVISDLLQLDQFIAECIYQKKVNYPIHLKINTGMNRLGFEPTQIDQILEILNAQPEVIIKSVYSHLADADNLSDKTFTVKQIELFQSVVDKLKQSLSYNFETHILNSAGVENFHNKNFSMVRIGIGMYGISTNKQTQQKLTPVLSWYSVVGQLRIVPKGETIGYGRTFTCEKDTIVATIPIGYADGLPRMLSNGVGFVTINGEKCPIIGKICMDMTMVDATHANAKVGDEVEIIGKHCSLQKMAEIQQTIPYEVMSSISERVHKVYIE